LKVSGSSESFFRRGTTVAIFRISGTQPLERDSFTIEVMMGTKVGKQFLRSQVETGSRGEDLQGLFLMSSAISVSVASWN
jgi:hypothetical protein